MKKFLELFKVYEWIFVALAFILLIVLGIVYKANVFEIISVLLGLLACTINGKRKKYAFVFYVFYVTIYGIVSFINKQYGEFALNICINLPLYLFTLYKFYLKKNRNSGSTEFTINKISKTMIIVIVIFIPAVTGLYGFLLSLIEGSKLPYLNALATSVALIATFLATKQILEQWIFWILYSVVLTILWTLNYMETQSGGFLYIVLNAIYILVNIYYLIDWIKIKKVQNN